MSDQSIPCLVSRVYVLCKNPYYLDYLHYMCIRVIFYNPHCIHPHWHYYHHHTQEKISYRLHKFKDMIWKASGSCIKACIVSINNSFCSLNNHLNKEDTFANIIRSRFRQNIEVDLVSFICWDWVFILWICIFHLLQHNLYRIDK